MIDLSALRPYAKNARRHSRAQIKQIAKSIETFGFTNPILVSDDLEILAGHGRVAAAQLIGLKQAPIVRLSDLSPAERKAYESTKTCSIAALTSRFSAFAANTATRSERTADNPDGARRRICVRPAGGAFLATSSRRLPAPRP